MDASKCQAVLVASETGSFSAAAEHLNYTQSGITRMISSLEEELLSNLYPQQKGRSLNGKWQVDDSLFQGDC